MINSIEDRASDRKLILFASACCRRVREYDTSVIELLELYADRRVIRKAAQLAVNAARGRGIDAYCSNLFWKKKCHFGARIISLDCVTFATPAGGDRAKDAERRLHADFLRDIFGDPFAAQTIDPGCRTADVIALARGMYDARDFAAMPVLADALQEAGCEHEAVLAHCRGGGPHVRGCWVVDLLLGKA